MSKQYLKKLFKNNSIRYLLSLSSMDLQTYTCVYKAKKKATATILYSFYGSFSACEFTSKAIKNIEA